PLELLLPRLEVLLARLQPRVAIAQRGLAFLDRALRLLHLARTGSNLLLQTGLGAEPLLAGLQEGASLLVLDVLAGLGDDFAALGTRLLDGRRLRAGAQEPAEKGAAGE